MSLMLPEPDAAHVAPTPDGTHVHVGDSRVGGKLSTTAVGAYGRTIRTLRAQTTRTLNKEPKWRKPGRELLIGAKRTW